MFYLLILPAFILSEGIYLVRHPKTFRGLAASVWLVITGISFLFIGNNRTLPWVPVMHVVAIGAYYLVKMWCHEQQRLKYRGDRFRRRVK